MATFDFTPDALCPLSSKSLTGGDITAAIPEELQEEIDIDPRYDVLCTKSFLDEHRLEVNRDELSWLAHFEHYFDLVTPVLKERLARETYKRRGEIDMIFISNNTTPLSAFNHYIKICFPNMSFWWKFGMIGGARERFQEKYRSHVLRPPTMYTIQSKLNQIFNKCTKLHTDVVFCQVHTEDAAVITGRSLRELSPGGTLLVTMHVVMAADDFVPSLIYVLRNLFRQTRVHYSTSQCSLMFAFSDLVKKVPNGIVDAFMGFNAEKHRSIFDKAPVDWPEFTGCYTEFLTTCRTKSVQSQTADKKDFTEVWRQRYPLIPIDPRLHLFEHAAARDFMPPTQPKIQIVESDDDKSDDEW
jgi:hypothetical protein